ncbi:MAG: UDP-3-O-(3-hydroxymyristoyl)glucosamine N-acyltransferase [Desulfosarcinaceae bacterium]|nr:UDP-3-O-(3-hydroxymyristoyl)glucosamine N-acyltransferase [Desulfosarcinaceae bacterium]
MTIPLTLPKITELTGGRLIGDGPATISGAAPFDTAGPGEITYAGDGKFLKRISDSAAGAILVPKAVQGFSGCQVVVANPQLAFVQILNYFHPQTRPETGVDPRAVLGSDVHIGTEVSIGPYAVIGEGVSLGDAVVIHANTVIGDAVEIGDGCILHPNVTIGEGTRIGNRVVIHAGSVIGSDGFGYAPDGDRYHKIPHTGIVQIDDDVEVGANVTIDRATFGRTWIQEGAKIDNLVQVAHNVIVGAHSILVAQVGIAGSVTIGHHAVLAGQAGIAGHIDLGDRVTIGPQAGVGKSIPAGTVVSGSPGIPHRQWLRVQRIVAHLPDLKRKLDNLERQVDVLTAAADAERED